MYLVIRILTSIIAITGSMAVASAQTPVAFVCETTAPVTDRPPADVSPFGEDESVYFEDGIWVSIPEDGVLELSAERTVTFGDLEGWRTETFTWLREDGVEGFVVVSGERLDKPSNFQPQTPLSPQRQYVQVGTVRTGIAFPDKGCWEVTGTVGDHSITWVMDVRFGETIATPVP